MRRHDLPDRCPGCGGPNVGPYFTDTALCSLCFDGVVEELCETFHLPLSVAQDCTWIATEHVWTVERLAGEAALREQ